MKNTVLPAKEMLANRISITLLPRTAYASNSLSEHGTIGFAFEPQEGYDAFGSDKMKPFSRRANTVAWIPPSCPVVSESDTGGEYLLIEGIDPRQVDTVLLNRTFNDCVSADAMRAAHVLRRWALSSSTDCPLLAVETLVRTALCYDINERRTDRQLDAARRAKVERIIELQLDEPLSISQLADSIDLSEAYFARAFKRAYGVGPHAYIVERRVQRARQLLHATHEPIGQIAAACGFADQPHLTRHFKSVTGTRPAEWRKMGKIGQPVGRVHRENRG